MAAEPRSGDDLARLLMEKASGDEKILLRLIDDDGIDRPAGASDLPNLSPWAAELRYGRMPEVAPDRGEMKTLVQQTKVWAEAQLKGLYDQQSRPDSSAG